MENKMLVVDTETTGFDTTDEVIEAAGVWVQPEESLRLGHFSTLIKPKNAKVNVLARAVHHISDDLLERAPVMEDCGFIEMLSVSNIFVGHNAEFDKKMLQQSGVKTLPERTICTHRCALHLYPDSPKHGLQVLRYYLDLDVPPLTVPPHRALADAYVTAALLLRMLEIKTAEELVELTKTPALLTTIRFGKFFGQKWADQDMGFLSWILPRSFSEDEKHTARHWLEIKRKEYADKRKSQARDDSEADSSTSVSLAGMSAGSEAGDVGMQRTLVHATEISTEQNLGDVSPGTGS